MHREILIAPAILSADFAALGANVLAAGSAVFKGGPSMCAHNIAALRGAAD
jgi:pentose-5-phosphate-3-epimerase